MHTLYVVTDYLKNMSYVIFYVLFSLYIFIETASPIEVILYDNTHLWHE